MSVSRKEFLEKNILLLSPHSPSDVTSRSSTDMFHNEQDWQAALYCRAHVRWHAMVAVCKAGVLLVCTMLPLWFGPMVKVNCLHPLDYYVLHDKQYFTASLLAWSVCLIVTCPGECSADSTAAGSKDYRAMPPSQKRTGRICGPALHQSGVGKSP